MHILLIVLIIALILFASYFDLRVGIAILATFLAVGLLLVLVSGIRIFGGPEPLDPEIAVVEFFDASPSYGDRWQIKARVTNNSDEQSMSGFMLRVRAMDCPEEDSAVDDCTTISDSNEYISQRVPLNQARDFQFTADPQDIVPRGTLDWQLDIIDIKSE